MKSTPNLAEMLVDPSKVSELPPEAIPALRGELARLDTLLLARLLSAGNGQPDTKPEWDRLLTAAEAAVRLGLSRDYLYRHAHRFPFTVCMGRQLRFSEAGIRSFIRASAGP